MDTTQKLVPSSFLLAHSGESLQSTTARRRPGTVLSSSHKLTGGGLLSIWAYTRNYQRNFCGKTSDHMEMKKEKRKRSSSRHLINHMKTSLTCLLLIKRLVSSWGLFHRLSHNLCSGGRLARFCLIFSALRSHLHPFLAKYTRAACGCTTPLLHPYINSLSGYSKTTNLTELFPAWLLMVWWGGTKILEDIKPWV